jgi:hypothetical protein
MFSKLKQFSKIEQKVNGLNFNLLFSKAVCVLIKVRCIESESFIINKDKNLFIN